MIQDAIRQLVEGGGLSGPDAAATLESILQGEATPAQVAAFLTADLTEPRHRARVAKIVAIEKKYYRPI